MADAAPAAERGHHPERFVAKRLHRQTAQRTYDVARDDRAFANRMLCRRRIPPSRGRRDLRAIADRPHAGIVRDREIALHHDRAAAPSPDRERCDERRRFHARTPNERRGLDAGSVLEREPVFVGGRDRRVQQHAHAAAFERAHAILAHRRRQIGQELRTGFHEYERDLAPIDGPIEARDAAKEISELAGRFDAGESSADDRKREQASPFFLVLRDVGEFEARERVIANPFGVLEAFERIRPLGDAGEIERRRDRAEREHDVIVAEPVSRAVDRMVDLDDPRREIDADDSA